VIVRSLAILAISVWITISDRILHTEIAKPAKTDLEKDAPSIRGCPFPSDLSDLRVDHHF
jgi:hypothetical protein